MPTSDPKRFFVAADLAARMFPLYRLNRISVTPAANQR